MYDPRKTLVEPSAFMKKIPLRGKGNGKVILLDDEDFPVISRHTWTYNAGLNRVSTSINGHPVQVHRVLLGPCPPGTRWQIDHKNGNPLDNRKENLRWATPRENTANTRAKSKSGYKGVTWEKKMKKWLAKVRTSNSKRIVLGYFDTPEEAAAAYNKEAKRRHGEFAWLNPIPEPPKEI